jgi:hypothetical protein
MRHRQPGRRWGQAATGPYIGGVVAAHRGANEITTVFKHIAATIGDEASSAPGTVIAGESAISSCAAIQGGFLADVGPATGRCVRGRRGDGAAPR